MFKTCFHGFVLCSLLAISNGTSSSEIKTFDATKINLLKINNMSGNIKINVTKKKIATVTAKKENFEKGCKLTFENKKSALLITTTKPKAILGESKTCQVNLTIEIPTNIDQFIQNGSGNIDIKNTNGPIEYKIGSGNITIDALISSLTGTSGSGNLKAKGLKGSAIIKVGAGNIELNYSKNPPKGIVDIKTGSGNAIIKVPKNSELNAFLKAGLGKLENPFINRKNAKLKISMKAGIGNLTITKL